MDRSPTPEPDEQLVAATAAEWAAWLDANHTRSRGVWLRTWRAGHGPVLGYEDAVVEALRYGWIDSQARPGDERQRVQWFSPRRPGGTWAATNKARVAHLEAEGRMEPAGRAVIERAHADGSWTLLDGPEAGVIPEELEAAFEAHPGSRATWESFPRSVRLMDLTSIALARRPVTRVERATRIAAEAAVGRRAGQRPSGR